MDTRYRPYNYERFKHLLATAPTREEKLEAIESSLVGVIDESKKLGFLRHFYPVILVIFIPLILLSLSVYIKEGWSFKLLPGIISVLYFLLQRNSLMDLIHNLSRPYDELALDQRIQQMFDYTRKGLQTKRFRMTFLLNLYLLFFPWVMLLLSDLILGPFTIMEILVMILIAYVINFFVWKWYFGWELMGLKPLEESLEELQADYLVV